MKYRRVYHMLVCHGHAPEYAGRIVLDASRRDQWSLRWIRRARQVVPRHLWIERRGRMTTETEFFRSMGLRA